MDTAQAMKRLMTICVASFGCVVSASIVEAARVPEAKDVAYPGTIVLAVDVTDLDERKSRPFEHLQQAAARP